MRDKHRVPVTVLAAVMGIMLLGAWPAWASNEGSKGQASAKASPNAAATTEDNDSDGQPNTPDRFGDSDNRHPSGKDKSAEAGGSANQGNSSSTPDQNGSGPERDAGGTDKPDGSGGVDVEDQDGNNGCGNDDDFEDDNEGLCLGRQANGTGGTTGGAGGETTGATTGGAAGGETTGVTTGAAGGETTGATTGGTTGSLAPRSPIGSAVRGAVGAVLPGAEVLSLTATRGGVGDVQSAGLAMTGASVIAGLLGGLGLIGAGLAAMRISRKRDA